ncbi:MAG TPA: FAD synthase [Thermoprotei archaeon]|nr:FAD synthase [Thermoprotei archaeon]
MKEDLDPIKKTLLKKHYLNSIPNIKKNGDIDRILDLIPREYIDAAVNYLVSNGLIDEDGGITNKGRKYIKVGLVGGVFDILHIGHIHLLREAKDRVDVLIVVIATDDTVKKMKNREPLHTQEWRREVITSLRYVDAAIIGDEKEFRIPLIKVNPDVIILGYDQKIPPGISGDDLKYREVVKLNLKIYDVKTSKIIEKLNLL